MGHPLARGRPGLDLAPALGGPDAADAADARRYGCDGLMGIHWRTINLAPNVAALAQAAWTQGWNTLPKTVAADIGPITSEPSGSKAGVSHAGRRATIL